MRIEQSDIQSALTNDEFEIYYQPLISLESGEICACEALLRWNHPKRGKLLPAEFIPALESGGSIAAVGDWVLRRACAEAKTWPAHIRVAVNVSAVQFENGNLAEQVAAALTASGLEVGRLEIELTESILLGNDDVAGSQLHRLRALGVGLALDDFGTGYSSLSYLHDFPFNKIKIDRSFVATLSPGDRSSRAIVRAVARLGASLGMATTVEGVETLEQLEIVRAEGCTSAQGYYFSRPLNVVALNQYIATNRRTLAASSWCDARQLAVTSEPVPAGEEEDRRLQALYDLTILDTPAEDSFDRITRIAMTALHAPMAALSLIDRDRQWFKSRQGVDLVETPRNISFCTNTIEKDGPFIVPDTSNDPRFCANPLVVGYPHIRFYLGVPLRTAAGYNIGALCINDTVPRVVSQDEIDVLQDLARLAVDEMELRKLATVDSLTGLASASAFLAAAKTEFKSARQSGCALACIVFEIAHLDLINATYGLAAGDRILAEISRESRTAIRSTDILGRTSGEQFAILLPKTSMRGANAMADAIRKRLARMVVRYLDQEISVTANFGIAVAEPCDRGFSSTLARADAALRVAKNNGHNEVALKSAAVPGS